MDAKRLQLLCDYYGGPPGDFVNGDRFCEKWGELQEGEHPTHAERNAALAMLARLAPVLDRLVQVHRPGAVTLFADHAEALDAVVDTWRAAP